MEVDEKKCPACAEIVKIEAKVCKHCGLNIGTGQQPAHTSAQVQAKPTGPSAGKFLGIAAVVVIGAIVIGSIAEGDGPAGSTVGATSSATVAHRYSEHRDDVYYYTGALSDNDKANGQAAENVVGFRYLGKNAEGDHRLLSADGELSAKCGEPCTIIHLSGGETMAFAEDSIIGAAFSDAINGQLTAFGTSSPSAQ